MSKQLKNRQKLRLLLSVGIVILLSILTFQSFQHWDRENSRGIIKSYEVLNTLIRFTDKLSQAESNIRAYVITENEDFLQLYQNYLNQARQELGTLQQLTLPNPYQEENLNRLIVLFNEKEALFLEKREYVNDKKSPQHLQYLLTNSSSNMEHIRAVAQDVQREENRLRDQRTIDIENLRYIVFLIAIIAVVIALVLVFMNLKALSTSESPASPVQYNEENPNARRDKIFSIVSHDLRGSASGVLGLSEMILEEYENISREELQNVSFYLRVSAKKHFKLLEELLGWARIQVNALQVKPMAILLNYLASRSVDQALKLSSGKDVKINNLIHPSTYVWADERTLQIVLRNLIHNALKFTPTGGQVTITDEVSDDRVEISIQDNGVGMDESVMQKLFDIEEHYSSKGTEGEDGSGMGLIFCKEFVERNGGTLSVQSEAGKGSTFTVSLPKASNT